MTTEEVFATVRRVERDVTEFGECQLDNQSGRAYITREPDGMWVFEKIIGGEKSKSRYVGLPNLCTVLVGLGFKFTEPE